MKIRPQIIAAIVAAPVALFTVDVIERWMRAQFSGPSPDVPDVFFVWCEVLLRLAVCVVLIALVWLVLYRSPGFLVACFYFIVGILCTLAGPLLLSRAQWVILAIPGFGWVVRADDMVQLMFPFFFALGIAAFIRSYVASHPRTPNQSLEPTAGRRDTLIAGCGTPTPYTYRGRVVDRRGRPVTKGAVIGWAFGPTREEFMRIGVDIASDGTFELPSTEELDEITASRDEKHLVTLKDPKPTGNVIVLP